MFNTSHFGILFQWTMGKRGSSSRGGAGGKRGRGRGRGSSHRAHALRDFAYDNERPDSAIDVVDGIEDDEQGSDGGGSGSDEAEETTIDVPVAMWVSSPTVQITHLS